MITSKTNDKVKLIKSLFDKKGRDKTGLYVCEGKKMVLEAYQNKEKFFLLCLTPATAKEFVELDVEKEIFSEEVFKAFSGEVSPQGCLAVLEKKSVEPKAPTSYSVFLDGVSDPSNVGMIIRTAAACGYNDVYLASCADPFNEKAVRASMSGIFKVNLHVGEREELAKLIKQPFVVADMFGENVFNTDIKEKVCLVIGNEAHGVSEYMRKLAKYTCKIPMANGMESLNAAVSCGILMYALKK